MMRFIGSLIMALVMLAHPPGAWAQDAYRLSYGDFLFISSSVKSDTFLEQAPTTPAGKAYPVRPDGRISLPMIGEVEVGGLTVEEAGDLLTERYKPFFGDARFVVNVVKFRPRVVSVLGEVNRAGSFEFSHAPTLLEALSLAGGASDWSAGQVQVLRGGKVLYDLDLEGVALGRTPNVELKDSDVVRVQRLWYKPALQSLPIVTSLLATVTTLMVLIYRTYYE